jgi:hypothetical protein
MVMAMVGMRVTVVRVVVRVLVVRSTAVRVVVRDRHRLNIDGVRK